MMPMVSSKSVVIIALTDLSFAIVHDWPTAGIHLPAH
jgi:hypothetical protein